MRVAPCFLLLLISFAPQLIAQGAQTRVNQKECREGTGDLGIGLFICNGGDCSVSQRLSDGRIAHRFSVEPRVREIDSKGPSALKLKENDVIVAVDGSLITSFDGGYKLANASLDVPIKLRIRRDKRELEVQIVPAKGCNLPKLTVIE